jgi:hypothetical protein
MAAFMVLRPLMVVSMLFGGFDLLSLLNQTAKLVLCIFSFVFL